MSAPRLLIADDQPDVLEALKLLLKGEGFVVETATSPRSVLTAVEARDFDALLVDMNYARDTTSGAEGLDLLARIQGLESATADPALRRRRRRRDRKSTRLNSSHTVISYAGFYLQKKKDGPRTMCRDRVG